MLERIAGFEVLEKIGEGGIGCRISKTQMHRAGSSLCRRASAWQGSGGLRQRFRQEARSAARLDNRHIVTIFAFGEHGDVPFIAMSTRSGHDLERLIRLKKPLSLVQKLARSSNHSVTGWPTHTITTSSTATSSPPI